MFIVKLLGSENDDNDAPDVVDDGGCEVSVFMFIWMPTQGRDMSAFPHYCAFLTVAHGVGRRWQTLANILCVLVCFFVTIVYGTLKLVVDTHLLPQSLNCSLLYVRPTRLTLVL